MKQNKVLKFLNKYKIIILASIILVTMIVFIMIILNSLLIPEEGKTTTVITKLHDIQGYDYELNDIDGQLVNDMFYELDEVLKEEEIDEEKYVELISKMFIIKFFTLENKLSNSDIGGVEFVDPLIKENFILKATNTLYKYIEVDIFGERTQQLPVVSSVEILSIENEKISYDEDRYYDNDGFVVEVTWEYEEDLGYQTNATLKFVHNDHKIDLVEISQ